MNPTTLYRLSIALSVLLSLAAFITLIAWIVSMVTSTGTRTLFSYIPWGTLLLVAGAALNCTLRARLIVRKRQDQS
jgi:hypothetical protein